MADPTTFREVYDEHFAFVWKSLRRLGVGEADVPDAVQEVFLVVHRKLGEFEGRSKLTTWLFGIALRVARDRQKLAVHRRQVSDEAVVLAEPDARADVHGAAERNEGLALLESILDAMPLEQRAVFVLYELDGRSSQEIAEMLDIPLGTTYSRLRLAREVFQRAASRHQAREGSPVHVRAAGAPR